MQKLSVRTEFVLSDIIIKYLVLSGFLHTPHLVSKKVYKTLFTNQLCFGIIDISLTKNKQGG